MNHVVLHRFGSESNDTVAAVIGAPLLADLKGQPTKKKPSSPVNG